MKFRFLLIVTGRIVLPTDKVLIPLANLAMIQYSFDFILFFSIDKIRWRVGKAWPVDVGLSEW